MKPTRRDFLQLAGAAGLAAAAPRAAAAAQSDTTARGSDLPRGMTFCTLRREGGFTLGVRTPKGILDVEKAARALRKKAPATIDELLRSGDGTPRNAPVPPPPATPAPQPP